MADINPLALRARSYRTFAELDLTLPEGCIALIGPNGSGKSSIVNLVDVCLFGGRDLGRFLTRDSGETEMMIELTFDHAGDVYRVRRSYSARGRGQTKVDLERHAENFNTFEQETNPNGAYWEPLTRETARETDAAISELIGLSRETFRASAFLGQGDGGRFAEAQPRDRKTILAEILGLDKWDVLLEKARLERGVADRALAAIAGQLELADTELREKPAIVTERDSAEAHRLELVALVDADADTLQEAEERLAKAREAQAVLDAARHTAAVAANALSEAISRKATLQAEAVQIDDALTQRDSFQQLADDTETLEAGKAGIEKAIVDCERVTAERDRARVELQRLTVERTQLLDRAKNEDDTAAIERAKATSLEQAEDAICPTCEQLVHGDAKAKSIAMLLVNAKTCEEKALEQRARATELEERISEIRPHAEGDLPELPNRARLEWLDSMLTRARGAQAELARLDERAKRKATVAAELADLETGFAQLEQANADAQAAYEKLAATRADLPQLEKAVTIGAEALKVRREELTVAERQVARCDQRLERLADLETSTVELRERRDKILSEIAVLAACEKAFGRDGIPALILENVAIPQIELEANRLIAELGRPYRIELRTQRALKSGEGLREVLDIVILDGGEEALYEDFSGGERTRVNLALRVALARLLATRRGAEVPLLILDEPDYLDRAGVEQLAAALRDLHAQGGLSRIILISHDTDLREAFETVIEVEKDDDGRSRVVGSAVEVVLA